METLQVVREGGEQPTPSHHGRGWSIATWSTAAGTEDSGSKGKGGELSAATSRQSWIPWRDKKHKDEEENAAEGDEKKTKHAEMAHFDPDNDPTDPTPFKEKPSRLAMLVDPKSLHGLEKIGGIDGLLEGLGVDGTKGLLAGGEEAQALQGQERGSSDVPRLSGPQWSASMDARREVYGRNDLPERSSKSFFLFMWLAFKDKVLVSTTAV